MNLPSGEHLTTRTAPHETSREERYDRIVTTDTAPGCCHKPPCFLVARTTVTWVQR